MTSLHQAAYSAGDHILFVPASSVPPSASSSASVDQFVFGKITRVGHDGGGVYSRYSSAGGSSSRPNSARNTPRDTGSSGLFYDVTPLLTCHTIASKKTPGKQLARAACYTPLQPQKKGKSPAEDELLQKNDIDDLNERRLQLQMDVDTSRARLSEIDLYIQSIELNKAEVRQRSAEAVIAADKEVLLAKANLRAAKAEDWKRLLTQYRANGADRSKVLAAVVEAVIALTSVPADTSEKDLMKGVLAIKAATVATKHKKGLKKVEQCLNSYPSRSVPAEQALLTNLYKWMQAVARSARAHLEKENTNASSEVHEAAGAGEGAVKTSTLKKRAGTRDSSPDPSKPAESAEVATLRKEQAEHQEYLDVAVEELAAIDELIKEGRAALTGENLSFRVPASLVAGLVPSSNDLQSILKAAAAHNQAPGAPVKLTMKVGTELADLMTRYRLNAAAARQQAFRRSTSGPNGGSGNRLANNNHNNPSNNRSRAGSAGRFSSGGSSPRGPHSQGHTQPSTAREGSVPNIPPLPLSELKARKSSSARGKSTPADSLEREDTLDQSLRWRFEKLNSSPRLPTPRVGPPLLDDSVSLLNRNSQRLFGAGLSNYHNAPKGGGDDDDALQGAGEANNRGNSSHFSRSVSVVPAAVVAQERNLSQQKISELELKLERALQANPKEAELQLLRDELKGTKQDLRRVTEERDGLLKERKERSQFSVLNRRMISQPLAATAPSESEEDEGTLSRMRLGGSARYGDLAVIDELEEQLNAAHRRIRELEAAHNNSNPSTDKNEGSHQSGAPMTVPAVGGASKPVSSTKGPVVSMDALSSPPPPPSFSADRMAAFNKHASTPAGAAAGAAGGPGVGGSCSDLDGDSLLTLSHGVTPTLIHNDDKEESSEPNSPSPELTAAQQKVQEVLVQLAQAQQTRQELQAKMEAMQKEYESSKKSSKELEERLNLALHAREQSQAQADQQRRELDVMWARLEEAEAQLQEHQERESIARLQQEYLAEESSILHGGNRSHNYNLPSPEHVNIARAMNMMSLPSVVNQGANTELGSEPPSMFLSAANFTSNQKDSVDNREPTTNNVTNAVFDDGELSRASSPAMYNLRDASQSPQPFAGLLSNAGSPGRVISTQPVENMSAMELRHEVRLLREAVEGLQSSELRLSTELNGVREKQKDERRRRQQARTVRLRMLNRLQEAVQQAMDRGDDMATVPDFLERTREETEAILAHRRRSR